MRKIVAALYMTLDGVVENPAWTGPYFNHELAAMQHELLFASDALLLGRVTYQGFAAAWPAMTDEQGFADRMNTLPKFVASTGPEASAWNATMLRGNVVEAVADLKQQPGQSILMYGSGELIQTLLPHGLIDELRLMIFPVILGTGKRLFADSSQTTLRLIDTKTTQSGVAILTYQPA